MALTAICINAIRRLLHKTGDGTARLALWLGSDRRKKKCHKIQSDNKPFSLHTEKKTLSPRMKRKMDNVLSTRAIFFVW